MEGKDGRTERATGKKRQKERVEGNLCVSPEVTSMVVLLMGVIALRLSVPFIYRRLTGLYMLMTQFDLLGEWTSTSVKSLTAGVTMAAVAMLAPIVLPLMLGAVIANMVQTKPYFSTKTLKWKLSSLNPIKGFKQLFSMQSAVRLLVSLLKVGLIVGVVHLIMRDRINIVTHISEYSCAMSVRWMFLLIFRICMTVAVIFSVIAAIDWAFRKYKHEKNIMMTKQEVKDERKQQDINPKVKSKQMAKMREFTMMRMMAAVPDATVVVTNPTHVAIALQYDPENMDAPKVTAKGLRLVAERIKRIARENNVPVIEQPVLARSLYKEVKVGREIPADFFEAVAELLAYLYKLGKNVVAPAA